MDILLRGGGMGLLGCGRAEVTSTSYKGDTPEPGLA